MPQLDVDLDAVTETYNRYSRIYDVIFGKVLQPGRVTLSRVMHVAPGQRILEIGVGTGLMLRLYSRDARVLGVDISERMLKCAREKVRKYRLEHVDLQLVDAEHSGLADASFDHVVLPYVYSVTPDPAKLIREAFRVCKPGGSIWILNHFSGAGMWRWFEPLLKPFARWVGFRSEFSFKKYVADQDWQIVAVYKTNLLGLSRLVHVQKPSLEVGQKQQFAISQA